MELIRVKKLKMHKNIEVELRGPLSKDKFTEIEAFLKKYGRFKQANNRVLIDYSVFSEKEGISGRLRDIRLRVTNRIPEIIIKIGRYGGNNTRKELSVLTKSGEFDKLVQIFAVLGFKKGIQCIRDIKVYDYKGIEFSLVTVPGHSYYFEAEKLIHKNEDSEDVRRLIKEECKRLKLTFFNDKTYFEYIDKLNKEVNEIFDFKNYKEGYFKKRFNL